LRLFLAWQSGRGSKNKIKNNARTRNRDFVLIKKK